MSVSPGPQEGIAYRDGRQSLFRVTADNRGPSPLRVLAVTGAGQALASGSAREFTVPAFSRRIASHAIFVPHELTLDHASLDLQTAYRAWPVDAERPNAASEKLGQPLTSTLALDHGRVVTGLLSDPDGASVRKLATAAQRTQNLPDRLTQLKADALPGRAEWLAAYDQLILATNVLADDPAALMAIRQWLASGGRLWVMLERVPPEVLSALLGDDFDLAIVDRVELSEIAIKDLRSVPRKADGPERHFADPVSMVRVVLGEAASPTFEVAGWPAAFWQKVGRGQILFTTLETEAWIDDSTLPAKAPAAGKSHPLEALASEFFQPRSTPVQLSPAVESQATALVGYATVSRGAVAAVLGACVVSAIAVTFRSSRWPRRAPLAWMVVAMALTASACMLAIGAATRRTVAPTFVSMQLIDVDAARGDMHVRSIVGAYHPQPADGGVAGRDCVLSPAGLLLGKSQGPLVWTDSNRWRLDSPLPVGLSLQPCAWREQLSEPPIVEATLTSRGIEGKLNGRVFDQAQNAILAAPAMPTLAVGIASDGSFVAASDGRLEIDQYTDNQVVSDEANRRQQVYRSLLSSPQQADDLDLDGPTLLFWTSPRRPPLELGTIERQVGAGLAVVPLAITAPPRASNVAIPSILLPFAAVDGLDGMPVTSAYSNGRREWVDGLVAATRITLRFQAPRAALPMTVKRATLHTVVTAPGRSVVISGWRDKTRVPIASASSPVGKPLKTPVLDESLLSLDAQGGLLLNIEVGPHPNEADASLSNVGWRIDRAWLEIDEAVID